MRRFALPSLLLQRLTTDVEMLRPQLARFERQVREALASLRDESSYRWEVVQVTTDYGASVGQLVIANASCTVRLPALPLSDVGRHVAVRRTAGTITVDLAGASTQTISSVGAQSYTWVWCGPDTGWVDI